MTLRAAREVGAAGYASRPPNSRLFDPLSILFAVVFLVIVSAGGGVVIATYSGVTARDQARTPISAQSDQDSKLLYVHIHDSLIEDGEDVSLVYIVPLVDNAPLPPGLTRWPAEGEVVLSPALLQDGNDEGIVTRYGSVSGVISLEGLASPTEKLAYIRPTGNTVDSTNMYGVSGFGGKSDGGMLADAQSREPLWRFLVAYCLTLSLSAVLVAGVAARSGISHRRSENTLLLTLGYSRGERIAWQCGKLWRCLAAGFSCGSLLSVVWFVTDIRLPGRDFVVLAEDARAHFALIMMLVIVVCLVYFGLVIWWSMRRPQLLATNRPVSREHPYSRFKAIACFASTPVAVILMIAVNKTGATWIFLLYLVALAVVVFSVGDLLALLTVTWARSIRSRGRESGNAGQIIGAAGLIDGGRLVINLAVIVAVTILMTSQVLLLLIARAESNREALAAYDEFAGRVVEIYSMPGSRTDQVPELLDSLEQANPAATIVMLRIDSGSGDGNDLEVATFGQLDADLGSHSGGNATLEAYLQYATADAAASGFEETSSETMLSSLAKDKDNWDVSFVYALVAADKGTVDAAHTKEVVAAQTAPMWRANTPATSFYVGTNLGVGHASWIGWLGLIALGGILIGTGFTLVEDMAITARKLAPLTVLSNSPQVVRSVTAIRVCVPLTVGAAIGIALSLMLGSALSMSVGGAIANLVPFILVSITLTVFVMGCAWLGALLESRRAFTQWRVGSR